jgi:hypothetical protein
LQVLAALVRELNEWGSGLPVRPSFERFGGREVFGLAFASPVAGNGAGEKKVTKARKKR